VESYIREGEFAVLYGEYDLDDGSIRGGYHDEAIVSLVEDHVAKGE
jgi:hypothetical protein